MGLRGTASSETSNLFFFRALLSDFSENEAIDIFLRTFFVFFQKSETIGYQRGTSQSWLPCVCAVVLASVREKIIRCFFFFKFLTLTSPKKQCR